MSEQKPSKKVRVWSKGQITIPASIREKLGIEEDTILDVVQVGNAIVATPERLLVNELASSVSQEREKNQVDVKELLEELRENSHEYETD